MIGILDSGIGGLAVARMISDFLDGYDIIFFGDTLRGPYSNKSNIMVETYSLQAVRFLLGKGARLIVVPCHDISSCATRSIAEKYPVDLIDAVNPSVNEALKVSRFSRIGVIGTRTTIESGIYEKKIKESRLSAKVYSNPCPLLLPIVEEGWFKKPETHMIVKKYIHPLKVRQIDTLIAACSYYFFLHDILERKTGKQINVVNSSLILANHIINFLKSNSNLDRKLSRKNRTHFYVTELTPHIRDTAKKFFKKNLYLEQVKISTC